MLNKFVVIIVMCCFCVVNCEHSENSIFSSVEDLREAFERCDGSDFAPCIKMRMLNYMDRLQTSNEVILVDGVSLEKTVETSGGRRLDETVIEEKQIHNNTEKFDQVLDELLIDKLGKFLSTHTVKFKLPKYIEDFVKDDEYEESGRGKDKGGGQIMMIGSLLGGKMGMLAIKGLGILTGMALVAAKIALAAATVLGLSKLLHKNTEKTTVEIVKHPKIHTSHSHSHEIIAPHHHHHGDDYRRSMGENEDSQLLAYNGQIPQYNNQVQQYEGQLQNFNGQAQSNSGHVQQFNGQVQQNDATTPQLGVGTNGDIYFYYDPSNIQNLQ